LIKRYQTHLHLSVFVPVKHCNYLAFCTYIIPYFSRKVEIFLSLSTAPKHDAIEKTAVSLTDIGRLIIVAQARRQIVVEFGNGYSQNG
ncbi:MAG: hypothetical protein IKV85_01065, partial [Ruminococcus sp.]|nr:hypothetical protein [Ruminococcus sp.]